MKKSVKMSALVLAAMLVLAGCGKTESVESVSTETSVEASVETSTEASVEASVETSTETSEEETSTEASVEETAEFATVEEYLNANPAELAAIKSEEESTEGLTIDVKDNTVTYVYTLPVVVDDTTKDALIAGFEDAISNESSVNSMVSAIKLLEGECKVDGVVFVINYVDQNGTDVFTCSFNNAGLVEE